MTFDPLPLYPGAKPCVRSGFCCKVAPCPFGAWDAATRQCRHLIGTEPGRYACAIADEIVTRPGWEASPAFGAGCCSPLNSDRKAARELQADHPSLRRARSRDQ